MSLLKQRSWQDALGERIDEGRQPRSEAFRLYTFEQKRSQKRTEKDWPMGREERPENMLSGNPRA